MRVITRSKLIAFWEHRDHFDAEAPLRAWFKEVQRAEWTNPADVKEKYASASILKNGRVVFNIGGNKYRLVVEINYCTKLVFIRFVGTHREYDRIDVEGIR